MSSEKIPKMAIKQWSAFIHEDGTRVLDLEIYDPINFEYGPIVGIYGLSPDAVARGVMAQKKLRSIPIVEYINNLNSSLEGFNLEEGASLH